MSIKVLYFSCVCATICFVGLRQYLEVFYWYGKASIACTSQQIYDAIVTERSLIFESVSDHQPIILIFSKPSQPLFSNTSGSLQRMVTALDNLVDPDRNLVSKIIVAKPMLSNFEVMSLNAFYEIWTANQLVKDCQASLKTLDWDVETFDLTDRIAFWSSIVFFLMILVSITSLRLLLGGGAGQKK